MGSIPHNVYLACSGGVDSMAVLDFLIRGKKDVTVLYFNHGTEHSQFVEDKIRKYCENNNVKIIFGLSKRNRLKTESLEEYWRNIRYEFFHSINGTVITAHHLDDVVETYIFSCIHGKPKVINYCNKNVIRPFLTTSKVAFQNWCNDKSVPYWDDKSNDDIRFARNRIRHKIIPEVFIINPGIRKIVKKLVMNRQET